MQLVTPEQIAAVMALAPAPHSFAELDEQVAEGLPKAALKAGVERLLCGYRELNQVSRKELQEESMQKVDRGAGRESCKCNLI